MTIVYEDADVTVAVKPAGMLSEPDGSGADILTAVRDQTGRSCLTVNRLDRGTEGLMVLANDRTAAAALSSAIAAGQMEKEYLAAVAGTPEPPEGEMRDLLYHDARANRSFPVKRMRKGVREAVLTYRTEQTAERDGVPLALVRIRLRTGRTHQIRVQFASRGMPLLGDRKYGSRLTGPAPALYACGLSFPHPATGERCSFSSLPDPAAFPWSLFLGE